MKRKLIWTAILVTIAFFVAQRANAYEPKQIEKSETGGKFKLQGPINESADQVPKAEVIINQQCPKGYKIIKESIETTRVHFLTFDEKIIEYKCN